MIAKKIALLCLSALLSFGVVEFTLRQVWQWQPGNPLMNDFDLVYVQHYERNETVGWLPRKNAAGTHNKPGSFATSFHVNSRGLRDREHSLERLSSLSRIVVLGDSFAWGYGVEDQESFPRVLESLLGNTEVINLGVPAFGTRQEIDYYKMEGRLYRPDAVVLGFFLNDFDHRNVEPGRSVVNASLALPAPPDPEEPVSTGVKIKGWLNHHVALYQLARQASNTSRPLVKSLVWLGLKDSLKGYDYLDLNLRPALRVYPESFQRAFDQTETELLELRSLLKLCDTRLIVVLIPSVQSIDHASFQRSIAYSKFEENDFDLERPYRLLEDFGREHGIEVINPYRALKSEFDAGRTLYLKEDIHLNRDGHDVLARVIAGYLREHPIVTTGAYAE